MNEMDREVARYVDGEMSGGEAAEFEARVRAEPALRRAVDEVRELSARFAAGRGEPAIAPSAAFRDRVLSEVFAPPRAAAIDAVPADVRTFALRIVCAAAVLLIAAVLAAVVASGRNAGTGRLEASPADVQRAMAELDARIESAVGVRSAPTVDGAGRR